MRKTSDLQKELMLEQVYRSKYNKFLNSKEGKGYYLGLMPSSDKKKKPIADRRGSQVSLDNTISYPKEAKTNQNNLCNRRSSFIDGQEKEQLPDDIMVVLVKNHKARDESIRLRKQNGRKILKEKQQKAQEEANRKRKLRMQGLALPEDLADLEKLKQTSEAFLITQKEKREASQGIPSEGQLQAIQMMNDIGIKREVTKEHKESLKDTIAKFNKNCFSQKANN